MLLKDYHHLLEDLITLRKMISSNKKILFQIHIRPNIVYNDASKIIKNREIIYNTINKFCENNENTFMHDPSIILQLNNSLFDGDTHFNENGYIENFNYIYNNYITHIS